MEKKTDFIIVGQGLAGTVLGRTLERYGKSVVVIDNPQEYSASKVAAGLWNPIVVRRFNKSWLADEAIPLMKDFYSAEEKALNTSFFFTQPIRKLFSNEEEKQDFERNFTKNELSNFADKEVSFDLPPQTKLKHGAMRVKEAGYMNVPAYLAAARENWGKRGLLREELFDYESLKADDAGVKYKELESDYIIFCEGAGAVNNPLLKDLPFNSTKGEILKLLIPGLELQESLSKQVFVMPLEEGTFRVGATYSWNELDHVPTESAKLDLLGKLSVMLDVEPVVISQQAGVRPTMKDRRPVIGFIKNQPRTAVFNGLGSRGVMLAPLMAEYLSKSIIDTLDLIPLEASMQRFGL